MFGLERGFVLHSRPYRESSVLLDVFCERSGRVALVAHGVRTLRSSLKGVLQPFTPLFLRWRGQSGLRVLVQADPIGLTLPMPRAALFSGLYLNELLERVLPYDFPQSALFLEYVQALRDLASSPLLEPSLRCFELALLNQLGYGVDFFHCAATGDPIVFSMTYEYRLQLGFVASIRRHNGLYTGEQIMAMANQTFTNAIQLQGAKRFIRQALKPYLGNRPLKSRELFILTERRVTHESAFIGR